MSDTISVIATERVGETEEFADDVTVDRDFGDVVAKVFGRRVELSADELSSRLSAFLTTMSDVVAGLPATLGDFKVEEMELSVEISAKGTISLMGTGGEIGTTGGLKFTLRR